MEADARVLYKEPFGGLFFSSFCVTVPPLLVGVYHGGQGDTRILSDRTQTTRGLAGLSTRQVPRWSLTSIKEALVLIPLATDRTEREARINAVHHPFIPLRTRLQRHVKPFTPFTYP